MFSFLAWLASWGMKIAPFYIPLMLGFMGLNFYLKMRASKAHQKPNFKRKMKRVKGVK